MPKPESRGVRPPIPARGRWSPRRCVARPHPEFLHAIKTYVTYGFYMAIGSALVVYALYFLGYHEDAA